ncbi:MAG: YggS family pyridoxal phosphate-dependent enzyme [Deltaproteobacteria bacterium]|nr:YggS family pyridoxal phosphate-dependent enzyme [Deltaproteobacteria bacterium]
MPFSPENLRQVRRRLEEACRRAGRSPESVQLLAVTKTVPVERIQEALQAGLTLFGENYIQEAQLKIETLGQGTWHFIGHLQRNKAKAAVRLFSMIETLDSLSLAIELNRLGLQAEKTLEVLVQINEAGEASKAGLAPEEALRLLEESASWPGLRIRGLMTLPPYDPDPERSRPWFRSLALRQKEWQKQFPQITLEHLSMGMSHDFEVAIEEGATLIRVGTALFGARG